VGELVEGQLVFRGGIAGFDEREHTALMATFVPAEVKVNPFAVGRPPRGALPASRARGWRRARSYARR
jgi:hypothetical protein